MDILDTLCPGIIKNKISKCNKINIVQPIIKAAGKINFLDSIRTDWTIKKAAKQKMQCSLLLYSCKRERNYKKYQI